ncbi:conserved hypothetical protein, partial [Streptomyces himastatinicus ATCC 53653]
MPRAASSSGAGHAHVVRRSAVPRLLRGRGPSVGAPLAVRKGVRARRSGAPNICEGAAFLGSCRAHGTARGSRSLGRVDDLSLAALGFGDVPAEVPLIYPGRPVTTPTLLTGGELHPLDLTLLERYRQRHPVIAVGSNASPAQLHYKLSRPGHPATVPMVPVLVHGIAVGCSAHIGRYGYVASAPYGDPAARTPLVVSWLDDAQLDAVDRTEVPNYQRVR